jgi:phosphate transport system substrate-binding protein
MKPTLAAIIALITAVISLSTASGQTLTVKVSDTLLSLNQKWVEAYKAKHPTAEIRVTGEGTAATFATLAEKKADLVVVSRAIHFKEAQACEAAFGRRPVEGKVAVSGLAVYVNTNNPVKVLNYDELYDIFHGESKNWKVLASGKDQAISVYAQATNSVHGELFNEEVLSGRGFSAGVHLLAGQDVIKAVATDPNGIGFGALTLAEGVQTLSIKRAYSSTPVIPDADNISRRIYPISRFVFSYINPAANPEEIKAYLDWIHSDEGQQVAKEAGFYALPANLHQSQ